MTRPPSSALTDYWRVPITLGNATTPMLRSVPPAVKAPDFSFAVELSASVKAMAGELAEDHAWRRKLADAIMPIEVPAIGAFTPAQIPYLQATWGPKDGYFWAIQRLTVTTLATGDILQVYRGASTADVNGSQNALNSWLATNGAIQVWNPGRTGCMMSAQQRLIFTGTLAAGPYMANADVIQVETWALPYFLL